MRTELVSLMSEVRRDIICYAWNPQHPEIRKQEGRPLPDSPGQSNLITRTDMEIKERLYNSIVLQFPLMSFLSPLFLRSALSPLQFPVSLLFSLSLL